MASVELDVTDAPREEDHRAVFEGLSAYNRPFIGAADRRKLCVFARDGGRVVGGLVGETARRWLEVDLLWIDDDHRGGGLGRGLLEAAEAEARARGCVGIRLETMDFQARPFYERHGYVLSGQVDDYMGGRTDFLMVKRLV